MTREQFERMPLLLRRTDAQRVLGVDRKSLERLRQSNPDLVVQPPGLAQVRYRKLVLAKWVNFCD